MYTQEAMGSGKPTPVRPPCNGFYADTSLPARAYSLARYPVDERLYSVEKLSIFFSLLFSSIPRTTLSRHEQVFFFIFSNGRLSCPVRPVSTSYANFHYGHYY